MSTTPEHFPTETEGLPEVRPSELIELADGDEFDFIRRENVNGNRESRGDELRSPYIHLGRKRPLGSQMRLPGERVRAMNGRHRRHAART